MPDRKLPCLKELWMDTKYGFRSFMEKLISLGSDSFPLKLRGTGKEPFLHHYGPIYHDCPIKLITAVNFRRLHPVWFTVTCSMWAIQNFSQDQNVVSRVLTRGSYSENRPMTASLATSQFLVITCKRLLSNHLTFRACSILKIFSRNVSFCPTTLT